MKIRFCLLAAGLLMCSAAFNGAQAQPTSKSSAAATAKKKSPATAKTPTAGKSADAKKPAAKPTAAKPAAKPVTKPKAVVKAPDKTLASSKKKARPEPAVPVKKAPAKAVAANTKSSSKTTRPVKSAPEKTVAGASASKKKSPAADTSPAAGKNRSGVSATAKSTRKGESGKRKPTSPAEPEATRGSGAGAVTAAPLIPPVFVPPGAGLRLFGMPTGLPVGLNPVSLMASLATVRIPESPVDRAAAAPVKGRVKSPVPLIDAGTARAAMEATAKTQSVFRPAVLEAPKKLSPLMPVKPEATAPAADSGQSGPVAFVIKAAPLTPSVRLDDFGGFGDFLSPRAPALARKAPEPTRPAISRPGGELTPVSDSSVKRGESSVAAHSQLPAAKAPPVVAASAPMAEKPLEPVKTASENDGEDLSERERAFVLSLTKAANRVAESHQPAAPAPAPAPAPEVAETRGALPRSIPIPALSEKLPETLPVFTAPGDGKVDIQSVDQTEHDQANNKVIYTGKVELNSKAVRLRGDRVEVFLKKEGGIERLEASGHVLLRTQATTHGPGRMASADRAAYHLSTGEITLSGSPKVQEAGKSHVSTDASTVMVLKADGRILTEGPNRTLIGN